VGPGKGGRRTPLLKKLSGEDKYFRWRNEIIIRTTRRSTHSTTHKNKQKKKKKKASTERMAEGGRKDTERMRVHHPGKRWEQNQKRTPLEEKKHAGKTNAKDGTVKFPSGSS